MGQVLGMSEDPRDRNEPLHLDLRPPGRRDEEVARVLELGATQVADRRNPDGSGWVVLADPEGNEFCVLRARVD